MTPIIGSVDLGHAYGDVVALHHVNLEVPPGTTGLVGANGAGKTTLMKILLGILTPTAGHVDVMGIDPHVDPIAVRSRVGYMPESDCLPQDQTAADFLIYAAELAGIPTRAAKQRASDVLTLVGLHEERFRPLGEFSTGMKQRAKLAQAIVFDPDLVLLDEPTAGLDPEGREEMLALIGRLAGFGINVMTSSHVLSDIESTADWVVMLDGGHVLREGPLSTLVDAHTVEVELFDAIDEVIDALDRAGATVRRTSHSLLVSHPTADPFATVRDAVVAAGASIRKLASRSHTLEDLFLGDAAPSGAGVETGRSRTP